MGGLQVPMEHVLVLAGILFSCGMMGLMLRRNIIFMLMSLEVMLNAAALAINNLPFVDIEGIVEVTEKFQSYTLMCIDFRISAYI